MYNKKILIQSLVLVLVLVNAYFVYQNFNLQNKINQLLLSPKEEINFNEKVINFLDLFIEKVLKAEKEIDFDTRLEIENAIRQIGDQEILDQWNKFVNSRDEETAQKEVKNLLEILVKKIKK